MTRLLIPVNGPPGKGAAVLKGEAQLKEGLGRQVSLVWVSLDTNDAAWGFPRGHSEHWSGHLLAVTRFITGFVE